MNAFPPDCLPQQADLAWPNGLISSQWEAGLCRYSVTGLMHLNIGAIGGPRMVDLFGGAIRSLWS
jgi:hypothetical protein